MKNENIFIAVLVIGLAYIACKRKANNNTYTISRVIENWKDTLETGSPYDMAQLYSPNAVLLGTFSEQLEIGTDEIAKYFKSFLDYNPKCTLTEIEVKNEGSSIAVANGYYEFNLEGSVHYKSQSTVPKKQGGRDMVKARFTYVLKKNLFDKEWKIITHHSSKTFIYYTHSSKNTY